MMPARNFAAEMIHAWAEAGWPVRCAVSGEVSYRTSGLIVEREEIVYILAGDGSTSMLPPELLSADRVVSSTSRSGVVQLRFFFPHCEIVLDDAETGGSHATH